MKKVHYFLILTIILISTFFITSNKSYDNEINSLSRRYDLISVTSSLSESYCNSANDFFINQLNFCSQYFEKLGNHYFMANTKVFDFYFWKKNSPKKYVDSLLNGDYKARTEPETMFIGQYNSWLLHLAGYYKSQNLLSPLNFNFISIINSLFIENSKLFSGFCFIVSALSILFLSIYYPIPIVLISFFTTYALSLSISTLFFTIPYQYVSSNLTFCISSLALLLASTWDKKCSSISPILLKRPFFFIPLAIIPIILSLLFISFALFYSSSFQCYPFLCSSIFGVLAGLLLFSKKDEFNNFLDTDKTKILTTNKIIRKEFDNSIALKNQIDLIFEQFIQGTITADHQKSLVILVGYYLKNLELKNDNHLFITTFVKFSPHFKTTELLSKCSPLWLHILIQNYSNALNDSVKSELTHYLSGFNLNIKADKVFRGQSIKASRLRRLIAFLIDITLIKITGSLIIQSLPSALFINTYVAHLFALLLIQAYPLLRWSASIGKKVLGIKIVIGNTNIPPIWWILYLREFVGKPLSSFLLGLGHFIILFPGKLTLHDRLFKTSVIVENQSN